MKEVLLAMLAIVGSGQHGYMPAFPATGRCVLRHGRVSVPGQVYLLTTTTYRRQRLFVAPARARIASGVIHSATTWGDASLFAWVLMPDHWHGLLQLGNEPLARVINRFKANVTRALHASSVTNQRVWDRSFHDHALRADEDVRRIARYIVANPIRAGLAKSALDYSYWNAIWLDREVPPML
ncbi:transposase [Rhodanobacter sp. 115]|uniref:REP-associated tyrosine transposase n=2 Tax=Bacteria TaxID=2 RepID=UPI0031B5ED74